MSKINKPIIAAILSLFLAGLGQLYNREIKNGITFFIVILFIYSIFLPLDRIFILPFIIVWLYNIYDAYKTAQGIKISLTDEFSKLGIPGFRDRKKWKIFIAVPIYIILIFIFMAFLSVMISSPQQKQNPIKDISEKINDTLYNTEANIMSVNNSEVPVLLYGEKTDVVLGEDILLKLSAANLINKPPMTVQVLIYAPSGMSVTSSEFAKSAAGIYTTNYILNPGDAKDIEVMVKSNQIGSFNIKGRIVYYFEDKSVAVDQILILPVRVRPK